MKDQMKQFEVILDDEFDNLPIMDYDRFDSIATVVNVYEMARMMGYPVWYGAMDVLISKLLMNVKGKKKDTPMKIAALSLEYAQNYWYLRDYFWYAYNIPDSVQWNFEYNQITIELLDDSFQLQHFLIVNNHYLRSMELFSEYSENKRIQELVDKCEEEFVQTLEGEKAFDLCVREAELKIENYDGFLTDEVEFNGYSVAEFKMVYTYILARAILTRYFNKKYFNQEKEHRTPIIKIDRETFIDALEEATGCSQECISNILNDLTLDESKASKSQGINTFPLVLNPEEDSYLLFPNSVCACNVFYSLRKVWAFTNPEKYGKEVANIVGEELSKHVEDTLTKNKFPYVKRGVSIGREVPDIDIMAVWPEKEFGNVIFIIETKNQIPEVFGRDFVRSIQSEDFLTKAKDQIIEIKKALASEKFLGLLKNNFPDKVVSQELHALKIIIVTAQNIGLFFNQEEADIIDHQTFDRIVNSFGGDILNILHLLKRTELINISKKGSNVVHKKFNIGKYRVEIPVIDIRKLIKFS